MRPRCAFGMVLHRKSRFAFYPYTFDGLIIQVYMRDLNMTLLFSQLPGQHQSRGSVW
jgi:hypothetical protein